MRDSLKRVLILLTCLSLFNALGQSDSTSTSGEIIAGEIVIEKEKRIVLPKADKVYLRSEVIPFETVPLKQQFEIKSPEMKWPEYQANIPFKRVQPTKPVDLHQNYVKFGLGNDRSWLLESAL
ncbi:MAG: hypothetical protein HRT61_23895, partial [Ekhidna sp.]|nr:hypothetical protein [Ekhidna sp.]